ncbi:glycosyltransferase [Patescibacteria group bacterium]|nr:glycosyltransferase [Patescibacteria group bacterium]
MIDFNDYRRVAGDEIVDQIIKEVKPLQGKDVHHVNSTYYGGGVAEILDSLVFLMNKIGINAGWRLIKGSDEFFHVTKLIHDGCQGADISLTPSMIQVYEETIARNANFTHLKNSDAVIAHDPQVLPLITHYKKNQPWVWRCHIDITRPNPALWDFLKNFINKYDEMVVSDKSFIKEDIKIRQSIIMPSIDPLTDKNKEISLSEAEIILGKAGVKFNKPVISQIARFDVWKDPLGVITAYEIAKKETDCQLVLLGNYATDDPGGDEMYRKTVQRAKESEDVTVLVNLENNDLTVNALQRLSKIVIQKSTREGFGLTVSEALWKGTPVIGGKVGGIINQIIDGKNGYLVEDINECAQKIIYLLKDEELRKQMGEFGKQYVKKNFLITRHLLDYIRLLNRVIG